MMPVSLTMSAVLLASFLLQIDRIDEGQWFHQLLRTASAHTFSTGSKIKIAVIDSGVDSRHPDLQAAVLKGTDMVGPGDGHIDLDGHGTHVAGLIAAQGRVNGVSPAAKIVPVRTGTGDQSRSDRVALGIRWATSAEVDVISISQALDDNDLLVSQAVEAALAADIVVVAGAGNRPINTGIGYPAAIPGVVAVTGIAKDGLASNVSATGNAAVIAAPSDEISSTGPNSTYGLGTGTSASTAIVAGAVALVRARFPDLKGPEVVRRLTATAIDKGPPGRDPQYGFGVLNIVGALTAEVPQESAVPTATPMSTTTLAGPPANEGGGFPWWLLAVPVAVVGGIVMLLLIRRKTRED